ncbi:hypothetical protein Bca52824_082053 [Brassica carinata]|uniref:Uncharacterized protein n=1 Tax=Brassica carinata TaxID=52824 RepID=A0A8X7PJ79_BRACI|nr:hypothetical protein Bca52824_082053 [Brassica carinata]
MVPVSAPRSYMQVQEYEKDGYSEMQRKNDVECEGEERKLFQIRMKLGEEIGRGHFDYGCSPKFKKERLLLNASQNLRFACSLMIDEGQEVRYEDGYMRGSDARIEWERREDFCFCLFEGSNYERAQGREMYHYKRRKGRPIRIQCKKKGRMVWDRFLEE